MLFIFDDSLDKCIGDINDGNVSILECVNHACEHCCFSQDRGRAGIVFCDVVSLLISSNHLPGLDLAISLFLNKDMRFEDMLLLSFGQLMWMHGLCKLRQLSCFIIFMVIAYSVSLTHFFRAAFMDTCAKTMPTVGVV
jgi:hypothetical protein